MKIQLGMCACNQLTNQWELVWQPPEEIDEKMVSFILAAMIKFGNFMDIYFALVLACIFLALRTTEELYLKS